jgi:hypothetical protein
MSIDFGNRYLESQVSKYLTRWRKKNGLQDLEKAQHFLLKLIEAAATRAVLPVTKLPPRWLDSMDTYAIANDLDVDQKAIICTVHTWTSTTELHSIRLRLDAYVARQRSAQAEGKLSVEPLASAVEATQDGDACPRYVGQ